MEKQTKGTVISVKRQWWMKINLSLFRSSPFDGSANPYIIKVLYTADGMEYTCRKWYWPWQEVPLLEAAVTVIYDDTNPSKGKIVSE